MRAREFETVPAKKILSYVKNIQGDGHFYMDDLITRYPRWQLTQVPLSKLKINPDPEIKNPLGTNIHIDLDYVDSISPQDIARKPIVADPSGWIIDGNHRATAAQQQGLATIPAYVPVKDIAENMDHSRDGRAVAELKSALLAKRDQLQSATDDQVYDIIDRIMKRIARSHSISGQKLHDMWVDRYKQIPDTWIMNEEQGVAENKQPGKPVVDAILKVMPLAQEIWFHGSRAIGQHRNDSDTDILVVVPDDLVGDKYLGVVRILQKLSSHFDNHDIQPTKAGTNIHRIAQEEGRLLWSKNQGVAESENNDTAISLSKLGKFHPGADSLAEFVPERATARYALHPDKWESTFYSLTNKDSDKLKYYGPKKISIPPGTLVGDMAIANKFYRAKTPEEKQQYAELYKASLQPYPVDVSAYRMPELLIPRRGLPENFADGKKPGRKGLAKRSGVNTKASVSSLRKTAKNSSGEKQRMAHWLANMKAGRAKAKK